MVDLNYWLAKKRMTMSELSEKSGVNKNTLTRIKNGYEVRPIIIGKIAQALECDVRELAQ